MLEALNDFLYKLYYEHEFKTIAIRKVVSRGRRSKDLIEDVNIQQAYSKPSGITLQKQRFN